ncbi:DUF5652 family protein [Candidatus Gracilibacteria bacterium]|nr:DUF5652 family protein [Candidatus Gracilibacteria bacterium]
MDKQNLVYFLPLIIWEIIWKGIALWKAARNGDKNWFIALLIINSVGILPIIYIYFFAKKENEKIVGL